LLYGLAYAELFFSNALWPDFSEHDLHQAIASFQARERRFGLVGGDPRLLTIPPQPSRAS